MSDREDEDKIVDDVLFGVVADDDEVEGEHGHPMMGSPEWSDFVLSHLTSKELPNDRPTAAGLRRAATFLYGPVTSEPPAVHFCNERAAACTVSVWVDGNMYQGSAECNSENTDEPYSKYPLATAETRAEGRALKKALCLNVLTAEEASKKADLTMPVGTEDRTEGAITETQIKFIDRMCKKLDVNLPDVISTVVGPHDNIEELSHAEALQVNEALDTWSREPTEPTPQYMKLASYEPDWRSSFCKGK